MERLTNYIGGRNVATENYLENVEPATGQVYCLVPDSGLKETRAAVDAAVRAFESWSTTPAQERARWLHRMADEIEKNFEAFAQAESRDTGKPVALARRMDIPRAIANLRFFAGAILHVESESYSTDSPRAVNYVSRRPIGPAACISPWNLPLYLFTWKVAPALAAGCTVVAKPSELAPYTAWMWGNICEAMDLPPGVFNIVHGTGANAGAPLVQDPRIRAVSFTGGTATGALIQQYARFKKTSLELGGKNPAVVFADCDYSAALNETVRSSFANQGQICLCTSRILVEKKIFDRFCDDFVALAQELVPGDPALETTRFGALISLPHRQKVERAVERARQEGGTILTGGDGVVVPGRCEKGYFFPPTVVVGLGPETQTNQEEIFGPVVALLPFEDEAEALRLANAVEYGLAATVWTRDLGRAHRIAQRVEAGVVWVNCWLLRDLRTPFGGMKNSGVGREGGFEALKFFTETQNVCIALEA
ncbi:MAG: aldehyde dehydrogenase [Bacteroidia bacterium]|nr:aldehyde dehydrogenase [Bacteroidia bacterium]